MKVDTTSAFMIVAVAGTCILALSCVLFPIAFDQPSPPVLCSVIVFTAEWCKPCQRVKPALDEIRDSGVGVFVYDIDEFPDRMQRYGVAGKNIPLFLVYVQGRRRFVTNDIATVRMALLNFGANLEIPRLPK